jgi:DNA-binding SARP family transcriptional activator
MMEFRILGPLEVEDHGRAIAIGGPKQRALLALLLLTPNQPVSVDRLIDALWASDPPAAAANALQYHVSQLRKQLGDEEVLLTRDPGYLIRVETDQLDLLRFERLVGEAEGAQPAAAARLLNEAIELWFGEPLQDLANEPFAQPEIRRLEEVRLAVLEQRIEADLTLGRHAQVVPELEVLVRANPLREDLCGQLMRALYGAGRQAEALDVYRQTRKTFVDELGIEPSPALRELEASILRQDRELARDEVAPARRALLVLADDEDRLDDLLSVAERLSARPERELILARLLAADGELAATTAALAERRDLLADRGVSCRVVAYTTAQAGAEAALLASEQAVDLVLLDAPPELMAGRPLDERLATTLEQTPCDVGLLTGGLRTVDGPVVVPFGGAEHDWSAIELAAWLAASLQTSLRLLGTEANAAAGRRDASRLLARASLLVQQVVGIVTEPVLIEPGERGVVQAAVDARLLVVGLSDRWRAEGIGSIRAAVAAGSGAPVLFVRRGLRPGGLAPADTMTRFTWTLGPQRA